MNYQIILKPSLLLDFINSLPALQHNEKYYLCLLSRNKYSPNSGLTSNVSQMKRFMATKENMYSRIWQLECPIGSYVAANNVIVPQESLALYINPNPRNTRVATISSIKRLMDLVLQNGAYFNPHHEILTSIQNSKGRKIYMDFDFDKVEVEEILPTIKNIINLDAIKILKTRGGFHILVEILKVNPKYSKSWYVNISKLKGCDQQKDNFIPVPGTTQGGFCPHWIDV